MNDEASWNFADFKKVISNPNILLIAAISALLVGPFSFTNSYQDAFFVRAYGFNLNIATAITGLAT